MNGLPVDLLPERAAHAAALRTVFIADLHLGKAAVFRARGIPVPQGTTTETLGRLSALLAATRAERLVVLGDFLHARESHAPPTLAALARWRQRHRQLHCTVVPGNHDRHAGTVGSEFGFHVEPLAWQGDGLIGCHEPPLDAQDQPLGGTGPLILAGHLHPVVVLRSRHERLRLPCFWLCGRVLTLPAFGAFTGGWEVDPRQGRAWAVTPTDVVPIPRTAQGA
ncbi:MAG: ligase-associated DNA damage response endonuclease PdeM [Pseudomonadota bacterium]